MSKNLPAISSPPWGSTTKRIVALVAIGFVLLVAWQIGGAAWNSLIIALLLAYILSPLVQFFENQLVIIKGYEIRRTLAVLLTWVVVVSLLWFVVALILPAMIDQSRSFAKDLPELLRDTGRDIEKTLRQPIKIGDNEFVPWDTIQNAFKSDDQESGDSVGNALQGAVVSLASPAISVVGSAVSFLFTAFMVLVMLFYLMRDGPLFVEYTIHIIPESYRGDVQRLLRELGMIWNAYLRGQLLLCLTMGFAGYINALILGLPQPLVLGLLSGLLEFIPNIGPTLSSIPALLFALTTPSSTIPALEAGVFFAFIVGLSYVIMQQLESVFLVPRILGGSLELHPFIVLIGLLFGASLAGFLGLILSAPTIASMRLFGRYLRAKLLDEELFPVVPAYGHARPRGVVYRLMHHFLVQRFPIMSPEELDLLPLEPDLDDASEPAI